MYNYFKNYTSNTLAGSGNQHLFITDDDKKLHKGRLFYKLTNGGIYNYSLLFSNIMDSTFAGGDVSHKNLICDAYFIKKLSLCITKNCDNDICGNFIDVTFGGNSNKWVNPGEFFCTDPVLLEAAKGDYLCVEITFSGKTIPYHEESLIPTFLFQNNEWITSKFMPFPSMIGCDRKAELKIAYFGDSITQGIGAGFNTYTNWCAVLSEMLGENYAYWNLGLGYGRADDAASDGAWAYKAKQNDLVIVCFGVNDLNRGFSAEKIKENLLSLVKKLKSSGCYVLVQTIPPFNYPPEKAERWNEVNDWIKSELKDNCDTVFDNLEFLKESDDAPQNAKYGGHPDSLGCKVWAENLYSELKKLLEQIESK